MPWDLEYKEDARTVPVTRAQREAFEALCIATHGVGVDQEEAQAKVLDIYNAAEDEDGFSWQRLTDGLLTITETLVLMYAGFEPNGVEGHVTQKLYGAWHAKGQGQAFDHYMAGALSAIGYTVVPARQS